MLKLLLAVCVLYAVVYGFPKKDRCHTDSMEASVDLIMGTIDPKGKTETLTGYYAMSFEVPKKRLYFDQVIQIGQTTVHYVILRLYETRKQYTVVNNQTCTVSQLPEWDDENCVPDNATMLKQYRIGMEPGNQVQVSDFMWTVGQITNIRTLTSDNYAPVLEQIIGEFQGEKVMSTLRYENVTDGIKDKSVFDVPALCQHAPKIDKNMIGQARLPF